MYFKKLRKSKNGFGIWNKNYKYELIKTWVNKYADGDVGFATCVDKDGKRYSIEMDLIQPYDGGIDEIQNTRSRRAYLLLY